MKYERYKNREWVQMDQIKKIKDKNNSFFHNKIDHEDFNQGEAKLMIFQGVIVGYRVMPPNIERK